MNGVIGANEYNVDSFLVSIYPFLESYIYVAFTWHPANGNLAASEVIELRVLGAHSNARRLY